jgi:hypothetical protein
MTLAGRWRTIIENMPEMAAATAAMNFYARDEQRSVFLGADRSGQRVPEARPASARLVFGLGWIGGEIAAGTME